MRSPGQAGEEWLAAHSADHILDLADTEHLVTIGLFLLIRCSRYKIQDENRYFTILLFCLASYVRKNKIKMFKFFLGSEIYILV